VSRAELQAGLTTVNSSVPPADAAGLGGLAERAGRPVTTVSWLPHAALEVIGFGAHAEGAAVLGAMRMLPDVLLVGHPQTLDAACREVGGRLPADLRARPLRIQSRHDMAQCHE
jgi:hypothetical protein